MRPAVNRAGVVFVVLLASLLALTGQAGASDARLPAASEVSPRLASTGAAGVVPLNDCWPADFGDPVLTGLSVTPTMVADRRRGPLTLTFRATVVDSGGPGPASGIAEVYVWIGETPDAELGHGFPLRPATDGSYAATLTSGTGPVFHDTFPGPGRWFIRAVTVSDRADNSKDWLRAELDAMGSPAGFTVAAAADRVAPRLERLTVTPLRVDTRGRTRSVRLLAHVRDSGAGVALVRARMRLSFEVRHRMRLQRVRGTAVNGWWQGRWTLPRWHSGTITVKLDVVDYRANFRVYSAKRLRARGEPWRLQMTGGLDRWPPTVLAGSVLIRPAAVDVRARDGAVRITVGAADRGSGVAAVDPWLERVGDGAGAAAPSPRLRLAAGDPASGVWSGTLRLPRCTTLPGRYRLKLRVWDAAGQASLTTGPLVDVAAADHERPGIADLWPWLDNVTAPLVLEFSEDVLNVVEPDVVIWDHPTSDTVGAIPLAAVAGAWVCRDAANMAVDCAAGPIRNATFRPAQPWQTGNEYTLDMATPGTPGVRDLAGNPVEDPFNYLGEP